MRIILLGPSYPFRGGISHYTTLLFRALKKSHEVRFLSFKRQYPRFLIPFHSDKEVSQKQFAEEDAEPVLDALNPFSWFITARKAKKYGPDLVIVPWWVSFWTPQFFTIALYLNLRSKAKLVFICHNVVEHESSWLTKLCTRLVLGRGDFFIVHSEEDLFNLQSIVRKKNIKKAFHPTYAVFDFEPLDKQEVKRHLGLSGPVLLFFGFIRPYKGLKNALSAMAQVVKKMPDVTLMVVGEFWEDKTPYLELIEKLGIDKHVRIVDKYIPNDEIGKYFYAADVVLLPYTTATGSGIVQLAYGFSKPVIATRVGSLPEVVIHRTTGYLVEPDDPEAFAESILDFFSEDRALEYAANLAENREKFSWDRLTETIESFFNGTRE